MMPCIVRLRLVRQREIRSKDFIRHGIYLVTGKSSATTEPKVASFPPREDRTPPLMSSSDFGSTRATPINDDASSMVDGDLNYSDDDILAAYDAKKADEHGEIIILLRKRVRQVNFPLQPFLSFGIIILIV